jgi:hypothetical protein
MKEKYIEDLSNNFGIKYENQRVLVVGDYMIPKGKKSYNFEKDIQLIKSGKKTCETVSKEFEIPLLANIEKAQKEIDEVSKTIHKGKFGVGIDFQELTKECLVCYLWKD